MSAVHHVLPDRTGVVIVGAGLAGLAAARELAKRQIPVVVLEARDRVGGRTLSHATNSGITVDLGAQWIGAAQPRIARLVDELGLQLTPQYHAGRKIICFRDAISTYDGAIPSLPFLSRIELSIGMKWLAALCREIPLDNPASACKAAEWDAITLETWKNRYVHTKATRSLLDTVARTVLAAEPAEISFLFFLYYLGAGGGLESHISVEGGAQESRLVEGMQEIARRCAAELGDGIVLRTPLRGIRQTDTGIVAVTDRGEIRAERMIVAIPPMLASRIAYDPPLPATRDQLTQRMPMGSTIKCVLTYERPFWRDSNYSGEVIADTGPLKLVFDVSPENTGAGALVGFWVGDDARRWSGHCVAERKNAAIAAFTRFFGPKAAMPLDYVEQDWLADPWSRGCFCGIMPPGVQTMFGHALRAPIGRIHWAGTETAIHWNGHMEGALESGERAANEVIAAL